MEAEIDSKAFQEIMDDFVEVHKAAGQQVDVGLVLSDVKITLQASEKKYKEFLSSFLTSCDNAQGKVTSFVKRLTDARQEAQNQVSNQWAHQLAKGRSGIKEAQTAAASINKQLEAIRKQMAQIVIDYHQGVSETDSKLHVVKQLRDIIEDELINPGKSFIQVGRFQNKLKNLQGLIEKSGDTLYTPIIQTLVELASEQNFSDQKILQAILKNLQALQTSLQSFKKEKETAMNVTLQNLKKQEENLNGQLEDYHHLEQRYVSDVHEANQNTQLLSTEIANLSSEIKRKQDELTNVVHLCNTEKDLFKAGTQRLTLIRQDLNNAVNNVISLAK
jgi:predicted  nucleic acid-binding Zn-ribbon protein